MSSLLEYKGYQAQIEFDEYDKIYVGSIIGIKDKLAFHNRFVDELEESFHNCIDDYLDLCKGIGKEPEKCTVAIFREDDMYIAKDLRTSVADQGDTIDEALTGLKEALELYYDEDMTNY